MRTTCSLKWAGAWRSGVAGRNHSAGTLFTKGMSDTSRQTPPLSPYRLFRPFLWVAAAAFLLGFLAFLAIGGGAAARAGGFVEVAAPPQAPTPVVYPNAGPLRIA
jgi:hypothetical protein